jgi:uncharacterized protein YbjQ (UPF0145 family)
MNADTTAEAMPWIFIALIYGFPILLLIVAGFVGVTVERRHYESIRRREAATLRLPVVAGRTTEPGRVVSQCQLVTASVVISHDHFKRFLAKLRSIFGGRLRSYESLLDRARREAMLRLKEQCPEADVILNFRMETSNIANMQGKQGMGAVEVLAYGTAVRYA